VSFQLPPDGAGGLFSNGLRTDLAMTDSNGHATLHSMQLNRNAGAFRIRITAVKEQARAGIVSMQYIGEAGGVQSAKSGAALATAPADKTESASQRSAGITPNNAKMSSGSHKKWVILAVLAAAGGAAFAGVSHASKSSSSPNSSTVSIGTPTISVGSPNP